MPSNKTSKVFADRLQDLLADKKNEGKDLASIAKDIGISVGALSNYQNDKAEIKIDALKKIADYFGVSCDYLTGQIATKFPENYKSGDELGLSDESIEHLKLLYTYGASWIINHLFQNGFEKILLEANVMHRRKCYAQEAADDSFMEFISQDQPSGTMNININDDILDENNLKLELQHLREKGEHVSLVLDSNGLVMEGVVNIRMDINQYLNWRYGVVGDKIKKALIQVLSDN